MRSIDAPDSSQEANPLYFSASPIKFAVMSLVTFSLYELYWLYKNWKLISDREGSNLKAFWRAFFGYFYIVPLLKHMSSEGSQRGLRNPPSPVVAAVLWIVLSLTWKLPDPFWLISLFSFVPLLTVQSYLIEIQKGTTPSAPINSKFSVANWVGVVIGGLFFILAVVGTFMPE